MPNRLALPSDPIAQEMQRIGRAISEPPRAGELIKQQINRAARAVGLPPRRVTDFWYGRGVVLAAEADRLRQAFAAYRVERARRLRLELALLEQRHDALGSLIQAEDQDHVP